MGNPDQAITYLEDLNKKYADQVDLLYELGRLYNNNDKKDLAKEKFIEVLNLSPDHANAAFLLAGIVEAEGDTQSAIQLYTRVLSNNPDDETVRNKLENLGITIQDERETENITE